MLFRLFPAVRLLYHLNEQRRERLDIWLGQSASVCAANYRP